MSYSVIINAHTKNYPYRCKDLEAILLNTDNIRDLSTVFELITNIIFGYETEVNLSQNDRFTFQWQLKQLNYYDNKIDYDSVYNFLNTNSIYWSIAFKLVNIKANFKFSLNNLPLNVRFRIENGLSFLNRRLDTINYINLNAIEYYLLCFMLHSVHNDNLKDPFQRRNYIYNDKNGKMQLNSVYGYLLQDYLNYFLPIDSRDVLFPSLNSSSRGVTYSTPIPQKRQTSLLKNSIPMNVSQTDLTINASQMAESRKQDILKIDFFINLFIDLWLNPNNDLLINQFSSSTLLSNTDVIFGVRKLIEHVILFANVNYKAESSNYSFSNRTYDANNNNNSNLNQTLIDEIRSNLVEKYFSKAIYDYLKFNLENWPLNSTINLLIEVWLIFIQPWRPIDAREKGIYDVYIQDIHPNQSIWSDHIDENLFLYTDILQIVLKRYCIIDLTILSNIELLLRICKTFNQRYIIQKLNEIDTELKSLKSLNIRQIQSLSLLHQDETRNRLINVFKSFNKDISSFNYGTKQISKVTIKLIDNLNDIKSLLVIEQEEENLSKKKNIFARLALSLFSSEERSSQFSNLNKNDCKLLIDLINECTKTLDCLNEELTSNKITDSLLSQRIQRQHETILDESQNIPDMEPNEDGLTLKLSPRGRFKMINALYRTRNLDKVYDPFTAPIGDFENRFLVFLLNQISNSINERVS